MKNLFLLIALTCLLFLSCRKAESGSVPGSLNGIWKMVAVKDNSTNAVLTKPSSIQGDVILHFVPVSEIAGNFTGNTPTNTIYTSEYSIEPGMSISIPYLNMTKVGETSWGNEFVLNITHASHYMFSPGKLHIVTTRRTLSFRKL